MIKTKQRGNLESNCDAFKFPTSNTRDGSVPQVDYVHPALPAATMRPGTESCQAEAGKAEAAAAGPRSAAAALLRRGQFLLPEHVR